MPAVGRARLGVFLLAAASWLVACSGDEAGNITETEVSNSALVQAPEEPTVRNSLIETNDDESPSDAESVDSSSDESVETADSELTGDQLVSTTSGPTTSGSTGSTSASGSTSAQNEDSAASDSTSAPTEDAGSTQKQQGGSETTSSNATADDLGEDDAPPAGRANVAPPESALVDLADGTPTDLSDQVNGLTLLWFWSTDTPTSERESVVVQRFAETFNGTVDVVAVGTGGDRGQADDFLNNTDLDLDIDITTLWSSNEDAATNYDVDSFPHSLLVDGSGNIIGRWPGLPQEAFGLAERIT